MDWYILTSFLLPFIYCMFGFIGIWLAWDLGQNGLELLDEKVSLISIGGYYVTLIPFLIVLVLPIALLLAIVYTLSRMSRRNEVISFLTAGVSLPRILLPLFVFALAMTWLSNTLNNRLAPIAQRVAREKMEEFRNKNKRPATLSAHIFRHRTENRIWFIHRIPLQGEQMFRGVQVIVQDADGNTLSKYYANVVRYDRFENAWQLRGAKNVRFGPDGMVTGETNAHRMMIRGWSETPEQIISSILREDDMSVEELRDHLRYNAMFSPAQLAPFETQLAFRYSSGWICLVVALFGAPLSVVFNRRGIISSVATAIGLFFVLWTSTQIFMALGKGARLDPLVATWLPIIVFGVIGLWLLYLKSCNKDLPSIKGWPWKCRPASATP